MISGRIIQISIFVLFASYSPLQAQTRPPANNDPLGRSTPRGTVVGFLNAAHKGDWATAIQYLDGTKPEDTAELATQLSVVLDQGLPANINNLSDQPQGDLSDNLPAAKELAGVVQTKGGPLNVMLDHVRRGTESIWLFSPDTLKEIPAVYDEFNNAWLTNYIPQPLLRRGWLAMPLWQWLTLAIGVVLALLAASGLRLIALPLLRLFFRHFSADEDDQLLVRMMPPLRGLTVLLLLELTISFLRLPLIARHFWFYLGGTLGVIFTGWLFVRFVHVSGKLVDRRMERRGDAGATAVIRLCERILTVITFCLVGFLLLQEAGLVKDATTLVAGVSVGGVVIAFAAQKKPSKICWAEFPSFSTRPSASAIPAKSAPRPGPWKISACARPRSEPTSARCSPFPTASFRS